MRLPSPEAAGSAQVDFLVTASEDLDEDYDRYRCLKASKSPSVNLDCVSSCEPPEDKISSKTPSPKKQKIETTEECQQSPKSSPKHKRRRIVSPKEVKACAYCRSKMQKCSGTQPCSRCQEEQKETTTIVGEDLTKRVEVLETTVTFLRKRLRSLEATVHEKREDGGYWQVGSRHQQTPNVHPEQGFDSISSSDE